MNRRRDLGGVAHFVCATNRPELGRNGVPLEQLIYDRHCAAIWEYPKNTGREVHYLKHMERVERADLIFMFAAGKGIIGVGKAKKPLQGPFRPGARERIRGNDWSALEWQVPVEWLKWDPENAYGFRGLNAAFYDVSGPRWDKRRAGILRFFELD